MNAPAAIPAVRLPLGPQLGAPPSLEQVPIGLLHVDPTYQRATDSPASRSLIVGMVKKWDWSLCQPIVCARRADGTLWILDGQHRHAGARERGDIAFLPCVILSSLDHAGEARTFVELNTRRQKLSQGQIFHGQLAAGDPHARTVQQLVEETGWRVRLHSNAASFSAGDLECAPMMVKVVQAKGPNPVRFALAVLRAAYPDKPVRSSATLLKALFDVFDQMPPEMTAATLVDAIGAVPSTEWITRGVMLAEQDRTLSQVGAVARAMLAAARGDAAPALTRPVMRAPAPAPVQPAPIAKPQPVPAPIPARHVPGPVKNPFGTAGKGWCDQCDKLRSKEAASACADRFCKLRAFT
ncbi:hypothetical protein [Novosphingobium sp.]|uniref:hypothetical protein n=1 Tax=Novosphingobium sp. TaxID=1874826 RepID=UPI0038B7F374